jgi:hypothetical protein
MMENRPEASNKPSNVSQMAINLFETMFVKRMLGRKAGQWLTRAKK